MKLALIKKKKTFTVSEVVLRTRYGKVKPFLTFSVFLISSNFARGNQKY